MPLTTDAGTGFVAKTCGCTQIPTRRVHIRRHTRQCGSDGSCLTSPESLPGPKRTLTVVAQSNQKPCTDAAYFPAFAQIYEGFSTLGANTAFQNVSGGLLCESAAFGVHGAHDVRVSLPYVATSRVPCLLNEHLVPRTRIRALRSSRKTIRGILSSPAALMRKQLRLVEMVPNFQMLHKDINVLKCGAPELHSA